MKTYPVPVNAGDLFRQCEAHKIRLPYSEDCSMLGEPVTLAGRNLPNRFVSLPMEGCDGDENGAPTEMTVRRYTRIAEGGSALIWFEATAFCQEGRSNGRALMISEETVGQFARMMADVREAAGRAGNENIICILQLTHAGRYGQPGILTEIDSPLSRLSGQLSSLPVITDDELRAMQTQFVNAARLARQAGFDGVDIKSCHGYLLSSLLSSRSRSGPYGGEAFENRTRMLRETIAAVRNNEPGLLVACRLNVYDGIPYGWGVKQYGSLTPELDEPLRLVEELQRDGVSLLGVTVGIPRYDAHFNRPSARATLGAIPVEHPLIGIQRMIDLTGAVQRRVPSLPVVCAGLAWLGSELPCVAAGMVQSGMTTLIGQGRSSLAFPHNPLRFLHHGEFAQKELCRACSLCSYLMRNGSPAGCVIRDREVYKPIYQALRAKWRVKASNGK